MNGGQGGLGIDPGKQKLLAEDCELLELELEDDRDPDPEPDDDGELEDEDRAPDEELETADALDEEGEVPDEDVETEDDREDDGELEADDELLEDKLEEDECEPEGELELDDGEPEEEDEPDEACELDGSPEAELDDGRVLEEEEEIGEMEEGEGMTATDPHESSTRSHRRGGWTTPLSGNFDYLIGLVKKRIRESYKMLYRPLPIHVRPAQTSSMAMPARVDWIQEVGGQIPWLFLLCEDDRGRYRPRTRLDPVRPTPHQCR